MNRCRACISFRSSCCPVSIGGEQVAFRRLVLRVFVETFPIYLQETVEFDDFSCGDESGVLSAYLDGSGSFFYFSIGHLGSDRTFPYQVVQTAFLWRTLYFRLVHIGRADGLVGFLRSFRFGMELAALDVTFTHEFLDDCRAGIDAQRRQIDRVRTHVGDASGFIQALGYHHGLRHGETEFVGRFLLQRGSGERSRRHAFLRSCGDVADGKGRAFAAFQETSGFLLVFETLVQFGLDFRAFLAIGRREKGYYAITFFAFELLDFPFAFHNQAYGHALHASGRKRGFYFSSKAPERV